MTLDEVDKTLNQQIATCAVCEKAINRGDVKGRTTLPTHLVCSERNQH